MKRLLPLILIAVGTGCSGTTNDKGLASLNLSPDCLPKDVHLAPWEGGSDKFPWVTSNPFRTEDRKVISQYLEDGKHVEHGSLREVFLVAYWWGKPDESPVEVGLMGLRFSNEASALRTAKVLQAEYDTDAKAEPHTVPTLLHRGSVICTLQHTSAVDQEVWAAMVRLVKDRLEKMPP